jgi:hypothetical protein
MSALGLIHADFGMSAACPVKRCRLKQFANVLAIAHQDVEGSGNCFGCFSDASQIAKPIRTVTVTTSFARTLSLTLPALQSDALGWLPAGKADHLPCGVIRPAG